MSDPESAYQRGVWYDENGCGEERIQLARKWLKIAAEQNHVNAIFKLGLIARREHDHAESRIRFQTAYDLGHGGAAYWTGWYMMTRDKPINIRKIAMCYLDAIKMENILHAHFMLAKMYMDASGSNDELDDMYTEYTENMIPLDRAKWHLMHAKERGLAGVDKSLNKLKRMLVEKLKVENPQRADEEILTERKRKNEEIERKYRLHLPLGGSELYFYMGKMYEHGIGEMKQSEAMAFECYVKCAQMGNHHGTVGISDMHMTDPNVLYAYAMLLKHGIKNPNHQERFMLRPNEKRAMNILQKLN